VQAGWVTRAEVILAHGLVHRVMHWWGLCEGGNHTADDGNGPCGEEVHGLRWLAGWLPACQRAAGPAAASQQQPRAARARQRAPAGSCTVHDAAVIVHSWL
jgi:hypothetical protein